MSSEIHKRRWGAPPWRDASSPIATNTATPDSIDVAIVGGGFTGMSAAIHLARGGRRAVVFDSSQIGEGASGRTGGLVLEGIATGIRAGADDCIPALARMVEDLGIECDLRLPGCWEIEHQPGQGENALPWRDEGSSVRIAGAIAGGDVEPRALLFGLARAAASAGATIIEHAPVRRLLLDNPRWPALELYDGHILRAAHVVIAVNAWTAALVPNPPRIHSALTYACATAPLEREVLRAIGLAARIPFYTCDLPYLWGRIAADGGVIFGSGLTYASPDRLERVDITSKGSQAALARLETRVRRLHPALADVGIATRWAGPIAFTEDAVPILGTLPEASNVFVAGAYAGHGVAFSVYAGAAIARAIGEGASLPAWGAIRR
jgi:gamma-glutamylputrescine oxidase